MKRRDRLNTTALIVALLVNAALVSTSINAEEINTRMLPNDVNNSITHMRLEAILVKNQVNKKPDLLGSQKNYGSVFSDDCNIDIGNNTNNQSILSKPQTIIITGPVVNKCR